VLILSGLAGMLFFLDRQTLSVLKTTLKGDLGWTDTDYGWLVTTFMVCYTLCYLFSGRWVDRWGTRRTMPVFLALMSVAMLLSSYATTLVQMGVGRALLGVAEAGVMPATLVAIFTWFPPDRRGTAATLIQPIYVAGLALATPIAAIVTRVWSWHAAFAAPGIFGVAIMIAWWFADRRAATAGAPPEPAAKPVSYRDALRHKEIWGVILARLVSDPLWFFLLYWEPGYLQERLGLSLDQLARIGWIPTAVATLALITLGFVSDRLVARLGWSPARSRRVLLQSVACLAPTLLLLRVTTNPTIAIGLLCVVRIMATVWLNFTNVFMADLVPQRLIGTSIALMSAFGAATSMLCNSVVGPVVGHVGYGPIFVVGAGLHPLAALILWRCYRREPTAADS